MSQISLHHTNIFFPGIIWDLKENRWEQSRNKWSNALVTSACLAGNSYVLLISGVNFGWLLYWLSLPRCTQISCHQVQDAMQENEEAGWKRGFLDSNACTILLAAIFWGRGKIKANTSDKEREKFSKMNEMRHISFKYFLLFSFLFLDTGALTRDKSSSSVQSRNKVSYPRSFIHTQNQHRAPRDYEFYDSTLLSKRMQ